MRVRASSLNYRDLMVLKGSGRGPPHPGGNTAPCSRFDWGSSALADPQLPEQRPADRGDDWKEYGHTSVL